MRARLLPLWPALAETFGVTPWNWDRLAPAELSVMVESLRDRADEARRQRARSHRR